jgi:hypothetical protein
MTASIAAAKAEVEAALADPGAAFDAHVMRHAATLAATARDEGGGAATPPEALQLLATDAAGPPEARSARRAIFEANLRRISKLNAELGPNAAVGINEFAHLSDKEFERMHLTKLKTSVRGEAPGPPPSPRRLRPLWRALPQAAGQRGGVQPSYCTLACAHAPRGQPRPLPRLV